MTLVEQPVIMSNVNIVTVFAKVEAEQFRCLDYKSNAGGVQC